MNRPRLALLDRDGTINVKAPEGDYVKSPSEVELLPGAAEAVAMLNIAGIGVAVVTNQRGVARGRMSAGDVAAVHDELSAMLATVADARVDAFYVCPHGHDSCRCRKPEPGMLEDAARDFDVPAAETVMIGDAASDVEAGRRFGAATVQVGVDVPDLLTAVRELLA